MSLGNKVDRLSRLYPKVDESETPLPRSWSTKDKYTYIGLSQSNLKVHYKGQLWANFLQVQNNVYVMDVDGRELEWERAVYQECEAELWFMITERLPGIVRGGQHSIPIPWMTIQLLW